MLQHQGLAAQRGVKAQSGAKSQWGSGTPSTAPLLGDWFPLLSALYSARPVIEHDELVGDPGKQQGGEAVEDAPGADISLAVLHLVHELPL